MTELITSESVGCRLSKLAYSLQIVLNSVNNSVSVKKKSLRASSLCMKMVCKKKNPYVYPCRLHIKGF